MLSFRSAILVLVLCGCSSPQRTVVIPQPGRALWEQCHDQLVAWCRQRSRNDASQTAVCEQDRANEYAGLLDTPARRDYVESHGCGH